MKGLRIKDVLIEKGYTQKKLSELTGIAEISLSRSINGNPTVETLQKIADALKVNITELFVKDDITGFIKYNNEIHEINSKEDIENLLKEITILGGKGEV